MKTVLRLYLVFYYMNLIEFCNNMPILNFMPVTFFKQVTTGATNAWEGCAML